MKKISLFLMSIMIFSLMFVNTTYATDLKENYVKFNDTSIYTECYNYRPGAKEAIIYLHGLSQDHSDAEFLYDSKNPYMTISYDYFNHGKTTHVSANEITWENQLGAINAIINAYGLNKVYLVGHSIGADVAMMFAKQYPDKVKKVTLIDRAYYNYSDTEKLNFTKYLTYVLARTPSMEDDVLKKYIDIFSDNDITKTWDIDKQVLLLQADPNTLLFVDENRTIFDIMALLKDILKQKEAELLPDLTNQNLQDLIALLRIKAVEFGAVNPKFHVINTPFTHSMAVEENSRDTVRDYVLNFFQSEQ